MAYHILGVKVDGKIVSSFRLDILECFDAASGIPWLRYEYGGRLEPTFYQA